jgi:CheY-like chemotaxis protein/two-component sensor histidine kinase
LGFTELAMQSKGADKRAEYLEKIRTTGKFMLNLINETLDLTKITSGKLEVEPENCNIQNVLDTIVVSAYANAEVKGVEFVTELENLHFTDVYVDVLKLQKVILNLLSNAVKYTPAGGKVTMVMEGPQDFGDGYNCHIAIVDTGLGMKKSFLPRLFEPFAQERSKLTRKIEGTGLGMSIVKQLVDLLGGKITVDSEPGKGTKFDLWLDIPPGKEMDAADTAANNYPELAGMKVLLCEDNEINRELVYNLLAVYGVEVLCAADGQKGVALFAGSPKDSIDVILMDVRMPIMDGLEATRAIRAMSHEDARYVPIFGLTGDVDEDSVAEAKAAGMDDCLPKPVDIPQLLGKLSAALQAKGEK